MAPHHTYRPEVPSPPRLYGDTTAKPTEQLCGRPVCSGEPKGYREAEEPDLWSPQLQACNPLWKQGNMAQHKAGMSKQLVEVV